MVRALGLLAAFALDGATASGVLGGITSLIEQRSNAKHLELRSIMSRLSLHGDDMNAVFEELKVNITRDIMTTIQEDHDDAVATILSNVDAIAAETDLLVAHKASADLKDRAWQDLVVAEFDWVVSLEEQQAALPAIQAAEAEARQAMDAAKDVILQKELPEFFCDFQLEPLCTPTLDAFKILKDDMLTSVNTDREVAEVNFRALFGKHQHALGNKYVAEGNIFLAQGEIYTARTARVAARAPRDTQMCTTGRSLQDKCEHVATYRNTIAAVDQVNGNEFSHPDRVNEHRVVKMAECLVGLLASGEEEINDESLSRCDEAISFETDIGSMGPEERQTDRFNSLTTAAKFTCAEETVTFAGGNWEVPTVFPYGVQIPSTDYRKIEVWNPTIQWDMEDTPFDFC